MEEFWFVLSDCMGAFCAFITYLIVVVVQIGFVRIGVWEGLMEKEQWAYVNLYTFMVTCFLIFWCHFKCMTTEPGCVPKKIMTLNYMGLPNHMKQITVQLAWRIQNLQESIKNDKNRQTTKTTGGKKKGNNGGKKDVEVKEDDPPPVIDYIDKKDIRNLSKGAEDTSSESCCDSDDMQSRRRRRTGLTTSMERSMKRLLRSTIKDQDKDKSKSKTKSGKNDSDDDIVGKDGKIRFDRRQFDLDMYIEILRSLHNIQFKQEEKKQSLGQVNQFKIEKTEGQPAKIIYNDQLQSQEITQLESILQRRCQKCDTVKIPQSHHCSTCKRCVARMDHHCPWVNNCVGYYNQKHFLLFLIYVFIGSAHALVLMCWKGYECYNGNCFLFAEMSQIVLTVIAIVLALLFCIFVCVMFYDQISCIVEHTSTVDRLKFRRAMQETSGMKKSEKQKIMQQLDQEFMNDQRSSWQCICQVMTGEWRTDDPVACKDAAFSWRWFLPLDIEKKMVIEDEYS